MLVVNQTKAKRGVRVLIESAHDLLMNPFEVKHIYRRGPERVLTHLAAA